MKTISEIILEHYQSVASSVGGWDKALAEPIEQYLAAAGDYVDKDLRKGLRDLNKSDDIARDMSHNRQYLKRHLENFQLRADMVPFLIRFAPKSEDLLHEILGHFEILPVLQRDQSLQDSELDHFLAMGKFTEHSGGMTQLFAKMVASNGGLGPEDRPHVPALIRMADKAISWAENIKFQAKKIMN